MICESKPKKLIPEDIHREFVYQEKVYRLKKEEILKKMDEKKV